MADFSNPLWQSAAWERFQCAQGHFCFRLHGVLIIERTTLFNKKYFEIPRVHIAGLKASFWQELRIKARERGAIFTRIFPADQNKLVLPQGATQTNVPEIFPEHTLVLDLKKTDTELLQAMKPKGRYNIALAQKRDVIIEVSQDVSAFYRLLQETTARDGFSAHPETVYRQMLQSFSDDGLLLLAFFEGNVIAGGIFLCCGETMTYYYGASSNTHRNLMAPYLVQWTAIQEAQERGCKWYDFLGIAPENPEAAHRLFGVSQFKEKFGGIRVQYAPAFEVGHRKIWYKALWLIRQVRQIFS